MAGAAVNTDAFKDDVYPFWIFQEDAAGWIICGMLVSRCHGSALSSEEL